MDLQFDTPSSIHTFGGDEDSMWDVYGHAWTDEDKQTILQNISSNVPLFEQFALSIEGTEQLCRFLKQQGNPPRIILGSIIYHQLLYCSPLKAWYITPEDD
jgi:hypothetical protein